MLLIAIEEHIPQIACVLRDRHGASAIAYSIWAIWLAGSAATTAYALVNIWDPWLAVVNALHTLCCLAVIGLTAWKRAQHQAGRRSMPSYQEGMQWHLPHI